MNFATFSQIDRTVTMLYVIDNNLKRGLLIWYIIFLPLT